jgi:hypothetical protein
MTISNGDIIKAVATLVLPDGTLAQNVFHFIANFVGDDTNQNVIDACVQYVEDIYDALANNIRNTVDLDTVEVDTVAWDPAEGKWLTEFTVGIGFPSVTFTDTADLLPNQMAPVMLAYTGRPKSYGRKFIVGATESATVGSDLQSSILTNLATALAHYLADETVSGSNVLSPGVPRQAENTFLEFYNGVVNSIIGSQRRRKPGLGA